MTIFCENQKVIPRVPVGSGTTRPLPKDRDVEEFHGDPTVGPRPKVWIRGQKWKK